ncbi:MAG: hemolysin family protein [Rhabdochlamydiaceae bacterium]
MTIFFLILALVLLLFICGSFSAGETALFSLSSTKIKSFERESDTQKKLIFSLLSKPQDVLVTILILNILTNILVQNVICNIFGDYSSWMINILVPLCLTLIVGEIIPKAVGVANNLKVALIVAPFLKKAQSLFYPFRKILIILTTFISRYLFFFLKKEKKISFDELKHVLETSEKYGLLQKEESHLIYGCLHLQEIRVKDVCRPRNEILYFNTQNNLDHLIYLFVDQECSRVPICVQSLDQVIGIVTSRSFFLHQERIKKSEDLISITEKPFFIPESAGAYSLMKKMYQKKQSIALVIDEYGSLSGLVTLEDLIEVIIGEISDRRDEPVLYTRAAEDVIIASGKMDLSEFEKIFNSSLFDKEQVSTLNGWLTKKLGQIPKAGFKYESQGFLFHILSSEPNRIKRVYVRKLKRD